MAPKTKTEAPVCQICKVQASKYRCSVCPVRYCSVACYKEHKLTHEGPSAQPESPTAPSSNLDSQPPTESAVQVDEPDQSSVEGSKSAARIDIPPASLKRLTSLLWPPKPDPSVFTDPLKKEDPKPLRREELLRIATSPDLRTLLSTTRLPSILSALDSLPPHQRHTSLSRLLGLDPVSLSAPGGTARSFLTGRDSPPPLGVLLDSISGKRTREDDEFIDQEKGWYLPSAPGAGNSVANGPPRPGHGHGYAYGHVKGGRIDSKEGSGAGGEKVWIGEEEKRIMRLFAGAVCHAIDGTGADATGASTGTGRGEEIGWGQGGLAWEV